MKLGSGRWMAGYIAVLAAATAVEPAARAADVPPEDMSAARSLAEEGLANFDKGQFQAALDKLKRADDLVHAPTTGFYTAKCLEKLGRLVEASERYLGVSRIQLDASASDAFKAAVADSAKAYQALKPQIPALAIGVRGAPDREVQATIDGKAVPAALMGVNRPADPGKHVVEGRWGERVVKREVTLQEGAREEVILDFSSASGPVAPGGAQRTVGWAAVGAGAAGLVLGGVTFGVASGMRSDLIAGGCADKDKVFCPDTPDLHDKVGSYNSLRGVPAPALIAGGVLAAGGLVLILTAPSAPKSQAAAIRPWISPWGGGISGVF